MHSHTANTKGYFGGRVLGNEEFANYFVCLCVRGWITRCCRTCFSSSVHLSEHPWWLALQEHISASPGELGFGTSRGPEVGKENDLLTYSFRICSSSCWRCHFRIHRVTAPSSSPCFFGSKQARGLQSHRLSRVTPK